PRPRLVWVTTAVILGILALGLTGLKASGLTNAQAFRGHPDSVTGETLLAAHFPAGAGEPVIVIGNPAAAAPLRAAFPATPAPPPPPPPPPPTPPRRPPGPAPPPGRPRCPARPTARPPTTPSTGPALRCTPFPAPTPWSAATRLSAWTSTAPHRTITSCSCR